MPLLSAGVQVPPGSGFPPKIENKSIGALDSHKFIVSPIPADKGSVMLMVSVLELAGQVADAVTLYVNI